MGLLGKAIAKQKHSGSVASDGGVASSAASGGAASSAIRSFVNDFHHTNPQFHGIVFQKSEASKSSEDIYDMIVCHGATVADLSGGNIFVLLPGALDRELFAHRLCHSAGLSILSQVSVDSPVLALERLSPYLQ
jgi:hypothetical protein